MSCCCKAQAQGSELLLDLVETCAKYISHCKVATGPKACQGSEIDETSATRSKIQGPQQGWEILKINNKVPSKSYAYERLLLDAIEGERRLFIRSYELDAAWAIFSDPLLKELENKKIAHPELYPYGSRGPVGAHYLAARHNVRWGDLASQD